MKIIGLTGGIGSGKTTVAKEFEKLNIPLFIADNVSKMLLATDETVIDAVTTMLGERSYYTDNKGELVPNKKFIASKVFNDPELLKSLNKILHPAVRHYFDTWIKEQKAPYVIYEAAILFETNGNEFCDHVILVTASLKERYRRVMARDKVSEKEVRLRMSKQWSDSQRIILSDFVIVNEDLQKLKGFVRSIHDVLLKN
ncbi:dephospho-CoA kinase [uncultured Nonlabens sp.]|uniref:dephospho-CoA kinase n=1 Tax=uncultured Nonlabens sp. TaxID=859306 RepID=UPI002627A0B6|nr:dephospho-CoA kinase [uncultured Nonlabens sp.]